MNVLFGFAVGEHYYARRLDLENDCEVLSALGRRCAAYLRGTVVGRFDPVDSPHVFLNLLRPRHVPPEHSFVLGIFPRTEGDEGPAQPVGVLRFLHPDSDPATWYIPLLLLEPAARGQGLGSALHAAFAAWSAARGARRLLVAVSEANGQALHFWRDRLRYTSTVGRMAHLAGGTPSVCNHHLELRLTPAPATVPWEKLRV